MNVKQKYLSLKLPKFQKFLLLSICLMAVFFSCITNEISHTPDYYTLETDPVYTSEINPDWSGIYTGIIPAADGPGIDVQLTLNSNSTFALQYRYIDRGDSVYLVSGTFTLNETGYIVILDIVNTPPYYMVAENKLIQLDMQGNIITGSLADHYILDKK
jgi:uncharacterized lipoprotein NlpE involved in copper resistance